MEERRCQQQQQHAGRKAPGIWYGGFAGRRAGRQSPEKNSALLTQVAPGATVAGAVASAFSTHTNSLSQGVGLAMALAGALGRSR